MVSVEQIFRCTRCGACCHGQTTVSLSAADQQRMRDYLQLTNEELFAQFWRQNGSQVQMQIRDGHCIFYQDGCRVHLARPWRCGQWPLHPSILSDYSNFTAIADSCPGINRDLGYQDFCAILRELLAASETLQC